MVGGFNTNVRYLGRTFHVQTEDSGPNTAKIVTLLYEGGSILYSRKTSYQTAQTGNLVAAVRELMECQHKEMVEALKSGGLDAEIGADSTADQIVEIVSERDVAAPSSPSRRSPSDSLSERGIGEQSSPARRSPSDSGGDEPPTPKQPGARSGQAARTQPAVARHARAAESPAAQPRAARAVESAPRRSATGTSGASSGVSFGEGVLTDRLLDQVVLDHFAAK